LVANYGIIVNDGYYLLYYGCIVALLGSLVIKFVNVIFPPAEHNIA